MNAKELKSDLRKLALLARDREKVDINARARCFVAMLAGIFTVDDAELGDYLFSVVLTNDAVEQAKSNQKPPMRNPGPVESLQSGRAVEQKAGEA